MKKCNGCGAYLQNTDSDNEGYTADLENQFCERCFRIKHYNDYQIINKENEAFVNILKDINKTNDLVLLVIDLFQIPENIDVIKNHLSNDMVLIITKKDIIPLKVSDEKILNYMEKIELPFIDKIIVSSKKNYQFDDLYTLILKYKKSKNVYIVGFTNSGKSTLINRFVNNYTDRQSEITTSNLPSTTLNLMEISVSDDLTLIDTPGILDSGNIVNYLDSKMIKKIIPKNEIKPVTYQIKTKQYICVENFLIVESNYNDLTLYFSNQLKIERLYKEKDHHLKETILSVKKNQDIVIAGLGFIKVTKNEIIKVYSLENNEVYVRESLI